MKLMNLKVDGGDDGVADYLANGDYGNVLIMIITWWVVVVVVVVVVGILD